MLSSSLEWGAIFDQVKDAAYPACKVDIQYMRNQAHYGRSNPFDFLTPSGFASFVQHMYVTFGFSVQLLMHFGFHSGTP